MNNKNLLENVDYAEGESKSVTDFLEIDCNKCGNKIKFKLAIGDIKNVEEYIEKQQAEIEKKDKIIDLMALDIYGMQIECNRYFKDTEEVKQYFERKIEQ